MAITQSRLGRRGDATSCWQADPMTMRLGKDSGSPGGIQWRLAESTSGAGRADGQSGPCHGRPLVWFPTPQGHG
jgi:hypothetical protein